MLILGGLCIGGKKELERPKLPSAAGRNPFNPWGSIAGSQRGRFLASAQVQMALGLRRRGRKPRARSRGWSMESRRGRARRRRAAAAGGGGGWPRFPARGSGGFLLCDPLCFLNTGTAHEGTCRSVGIACRCWDQEALGSHLSVVHMSLHLRVFPRAKRSGRGSRPVVFNCRHDVVAGHCHQSEMDCFA